MAVTTRRKKCPYSADEIVVAWQSFGTADAVIKAGDKFRGDDPLVLEHWPWFQPEGTPTAEGKNIWSEMPPPPEHEDPKITIVTSSLANVPPERLVRARTNFWFDTGWSPGSVGEKSGRISGRGWGINIGQLVEISNPVVRANPGAFVFPEREVTLADVERLTSEEVNEDGR
jgi:hypothetical protein